ncbi:MAG: FG-GAP-like repeat-containing protein [Halioglobus sp.]|nr:FG-GAP-like repeat-containing protein [Halioglobus sp.]
MKTDKFNDSPPITLAAELQFAPVWMVAILTLFAVSACGSSYDSNTYWPMHTIDNTFEGADGVDGNDIDGDGDVDLVVGWEESGRAALYENPGASNVLGDWRRTDISAGLDVRKIEDAQFADFNSDGKIDAVVSATENRNEKVSIHWLSDRTDIFNDDSWKSVSIVPASQLPFLKVAIGQIDGSGANDIVVGSKNDSKPGKLLWYQAPQNPDYANSDQWTGWPIADINWITTILIIDVDQDGDNDVLMSDWATLSWFENPGPEAILENSQSIWAKHVISSEANSNFANCVVDKKDPSKIHLIVSNVTAKEHVEVGGPILYSVKKHFDAAGKWSGTWIKNKLSSLQSMPSDIDMHDYDIKGIACGNIDDNPETDLVISATGYGHGIFALMNLQDILGDQALNLKVISDDGHNTRKGIKHDNLLLNDLDGDGDLDVVTTEENGNTGSYFIARGLGLIWYENPL